MTKISSTGLEEKTIAVVAINENGKSIASRIKNSLPKAKIYIAERGGLADLTKQLFEKSEGIVFCMAMGIVVRAIAAFVRNKLIDPAVVAVDNKARFAISVLSGHEGQANRLAIRVANILGAQAVITTASEVAKDVVIGIGCRRAVKKDEVRNAIFAALTRTKCSINKVRCAATIDLKQNEQGLKEACSQLDIPLIIVSTDQVKNFYGRYQRSSFVKEKIGIEGVSEPCALLTARRPKLILPKIRVGKVTVAICQEG